MQFSRPAGPRDAFASHSRRHSPPPQHSGPRDAAPPRRAALGAPAWGPPPQRAAPLRRPQRRYTALGAQRSARRAAPLRPDASPALHLRVDSCFARRKLSSSRSRSSAGRRREVEFGLGPADVARVVVVGDRPPRSRRCADSGRPSPSRAAPSTPQPSTPSRRPQLNSWYVIF